MLFHMLSALVVCTTFATGGATFAGDPVDAGPSGKKFDVKTYRDIPYYEVPNDPERNRHRLDVYAPRGQTKVPVLFFVHGGAWVTGTKDNVLGIYGYGTIARCLAEHGLVVVLPNYRLSPGVKHPEQNTSRTWPEPSRGLARTSRTTAAIRSGFSSVATRRAAISSPC